MKINVIKTTAPKVKPDSNNLGFGKHFTDHMFVMDYVEGQGWINPQIMPYQSLPMDPACMVFHYAQEIFEGMKAYKTADGRILLFRPRDNMVRMNESAARLCIPQLDVDFAVECIKELVKTDSDWIPTQPGTSLYIRPFIVATDAALGVHASKTYKFIVILSPVGSYYKEGLNPVKIYVESELVRAVKGGTGFTKCGGNYAGSLKAQEKSEQGGYSQVLWLDGVEKKYVEEVGSMNVFFKINGEVVTPALNGSILSGVTRRSCVELVKSWGMKMTERRISIEEIFEAYQNGQLEEVFGTGTAAVISPVGTLDWEEHIMTVNNGSIGEVSQKLYDTITGIQTGKIEDTFGWTVTVE